MSKTLQKMIHIRRWVATVLLFVMVLAPFTSVGSIMVQAMAVAEAGETAQLFGTFLDFLGLDLCTSSSGNSKAIYDGEDYSIELAEDWMTSGDDKCLKLHKKGLDSWLYTDLIVPVGGDVSENDWLVEKLNQAILADPKIGQILSDFKVSGQMSAEHYAYVLDAVDDSANDACNDRALMVFSSSKYVAVYNYYISDLSLSRWENGVLVAYCPYADDVVASSEFQPGRLSIQHMENGGVRFGYDNISISNFSFLESRADGSFLRLGEFVKCVNGSYYLPSEISNYRMVTKNTQPFTDPTIQDYVEKAKRIADAEKVINFKDLVIPEGLATQSQEEARKYTDAIAAGEAATADPGAGTTDPEAPAAEFSLADAFSSLWDWLSGILEKLSGILDFIKGLPASIYNAFASTLTSIKDGLTKVYDAITSLSWSNVVDAVISLPQQIWENFEDVLGSVADTISAGNAWLEDIFDAVSGLSWSDVVDGITALPESIWEKLKGGFGNLADLIGTENGWLQQIYDKVSGLSWSDVVDGILALPQGIWDKVKSGFDTVSGLMQKLLDKVGSLSWSDVVDAVLGLPQGIWDMLKGVFGTITEALENIWDWLSKFSLSDILDAILGVPAAIWELFEGLLLKLLDAIGQICAPVIAFFTFDWDEIKAAVAPNLDILQNKFKPISDVTDKLDRLQNVDAGQADSMVIDVELDGIRVPGRDKPMDLGHVSLDLSDYGDAMSTVRTVESALLWVGFGIGLLRFFRIRFSVD